MPTQEEIQAYLQSLPVIYREILAAFPRLQPNRKGGHGLPIPTLTSELESQGNFTPNEVLRACEQLHLHGLAEVRRGNTVNPTAYGEQLIAELTGQQPSELAVPTLPMPPAP